MAVIGDPYGIFKPTLVLHENLNANAHLKEAFMFIMLLTLKEKQLMWAGDVAVVGKHVDALLNYIKNLLDFCEKTNFQLYHVEFRLYKKSIS